MLVSEVVQLLGADAADCWLFDERRHTLVCRAVHGLPESETGREIFPGGTLGEAITARRPVLKRNFARTEQPLPSSSYREFEDVMVAPITVFDEVRGVLGVCSRTAGSFDEQGLELLEAFAVLASLALRNAEAFEESSRQARIQRGFYRIASVLVEPLSLSATLDAVAQAAGEAFGAAFTAVVMPSAGTLRLAGGHELPAPLAAALEAGPRRRVRFPARLGGASHPRVRSARDGRPLRRPVALARGAVRVSLAAAHPARGRGRGCGGARARLLRRRALAARRGHRARAPPRRCCTRSARAERLVRRGTHVARARAAARANGQRPRNRARSRGGARRGRPAGSRAAGGRRLRDQDRRRRRAAGDRRRGQRRGGRARSSQRDGGVALGRGRAVAQGGRGDGCLVRPGAARLRRRAGGRLQRRTSASRSSGRRAPSSA